MFVVPVKNTYCDGFIQIRGSLPFYELHMKEVPRVREKQYTMPVLPKG